MFSTCTDSPCLQDGNGLGEASGPAWERKCPVSRPGLQGPVELWVQLSTHFWRALSAPEGEVVWDPPMKKNKVLFPFTDALFTASFAKGLAFP